MKKVSNGTWLVKREPASVSLTVGTHISCPCLRLNQLNQYSRIAINSISRKLHTAYSSPDLFKKSAGCIVPSRNYAECPCTPCCGQYLPPPSNCPAKCIQYVTGYYYYPYGFWFCGPYHVTGACCPCGGGCRAPCCAPCPKCCAPSCICPTCAACLTADLPKTAVKAQPNVVPAKPFQQKPKSKSAFTKLFPFQTSNTPNMKNPPHNEPRRNPVSSPKRYSTRATVNNHHAQYIARHFKRNISKCPPLSSPKTIPTKVDRDFPEVQKDLFSFSSIPKYHNPFPRPMKGLSLKPFDIKK